MTILTTIILGAIEGATEFLPISSTAHLLIAEKIMRVSPGELFNIVVQLGAIIAVIVYAPKRLLMSRKAQIAIILAFIPTAIIGLVAKNYVEVLHKYLWITAATLFLGGVAMLYLAKMWKPQDAESIEQLTPKKNIFIGVMQSLAIIPGVSRSAATIYAGLASGLTRKEAVTFSFFLGVPTMAAATFLSLIKYKGPLTSDVLLPVFVGGIAAFIVALLVIRALISYIENHGFVIFAWYRIALAILLALFILR